MLFRSEINGDWEPYIPIEINDQRFLAYCDIGSMMSTMPRVVFDAMNFGDLFDYPFCHSHSDGSSQKFIKELMKSLSLLSIRLLWLISWFWSQKLKLILCLGDLSFVLWGLLLMLRRGAYGFVFPLGAGSPFPSKIKKCLLKERLPLIPKKLDIWHCA